MKPTHIKYLFLAMSCNDPFFEISRRVVHDTWARDTIAGKYKDCMFFSYTSSSIERIQDNCIYVNTEDGVYHTYSKTMRAIEILKEVGYTWDVIIRTNTSTFINMEKMLKFLQSINIDHINAFVPGLNGVPGNISTGPGEYGPLIMPVGWMLIMPMRFTDKLLAEKHVFNESCPYIQTFRASTCPDDVLFGIFTYILKYSDYKFDIDIDGISSSLVSHFRTTLYNKHIQPELPPLLCRPEELYSDPIDVLKMPFIQVRKFLVEPKYRYIECEEMYELQKIIDSHETL